MTTHRVASARDVREGDLYPVTVGETDLVLVRAGGELHALYGRCTHYGAPLADGVLSDGRLVCPWHHACFAAATGALLEPPALDALPRFETRVEGDEVFVTLPDPVPERLPPEGAGAPEADAGRFVILGAGAAGAAAAEALREAGFRGRVLLLGGDGPYDRTLLSKDYLKEEATKGWVPLRDGGFYRARGIERLETWVARVDPAAQTLILENGETLSYDALLLATGSQPRQLEVPGAELEGVYTLRTLHDARALLAAAEGARRVVLIGASFIGMECASSLRARGLAVTVVTPDAVPFERLLGSAVGRAFAELHRQNGVTLVTEAKVARFEGGQRAERVVLEDGRALEADLVLVGIGVEPATGLLEGVPLEADGSLAVDRSFRVAGAPGPLYAAGDVARYPNPYGPGRLRVEHWRVAMQTGRAAARAMLGREEPFDGVPFFWTMQHGKGLRYVGYTEAWDEVVIAGDLNAWDFVAYYLEGGRLAAALGAGRDTELCLIEECLRRRTLPSADALRSRTVDWAAHLRVARG
jgi:NADPH-dependent 2,4-dienoyl-CoA reductase/sulfur reductase-like enzyme/nitrite reductase/ring-hydroxylating ferredoxin subunit